MGNDMRIVKFKMLIRDINRDLGESLTDDLGTSFRGEPKAAWLAVIFDYDKLNDYGKIIMDQVCELEADKFTESSMLALRLEFVENCKDMKYRMEAARALVEKLELRMINVLTGNTSKLIFIFWALMILAVDDADKEDCLSLICDFAEMLKIRDVEMMELVQIIRAVFQMEGNLNIQTISVNTRFGKVIERYKNLSMKE